MEEENVQISKLIKLSLGKLFFFGKALNFGLDLVKTTFKPRGKPSTFRLYFAVGPFAKPVRAAGNF